MLKFHAHEIGNSPEFVSVSLSFPRAMNSVLSHLAESRREHRKEYFGWVFQIHPVATKEHLDFLGGAYELSERSHQSTTTTMANLMTSGNELIT